MAEAKQKEAEKIIQVEVYAADVPAFVTFAEAWAACGAFKEATLRRRFGKLGVIRRMGSEYHVDVWALKKQEPRIFDALIRIRVRRERKMV